MQRCHMFHMDMDNQEMFAYFLIKFSAMVIIALVFKEAAVVPLVWSISDVVAVKFLVDPMGRPGRLWQLKW